MFGFSSFELIGLGAIFTFVAWMLWKAIRGTRGGGGHNRWGR